MRFNSKGKKKKDDKIQWDNQKVDRLHHTRQLAVLGRLMAELGGHFVRFARGLHCGKHAEKQCGLRNETAKNCKHVIW